MFVWVGEKEFEKKLVRGKRSAVITFIFLVDRLPSRFEITHFLRSLNVASSETACFARKATYATVKNDRFSQQFASKSSFSRASSQTSRPPSPTRTIAGSNVSSLIIVRFMLPPYATRLHCKPTVPPVPTESHVTSCNHDRMARRRFVFSMKYNTDTALDSWGSFTL